MSNDQTKSASDGAVPIADPIFVEIANLLHDYVGQREPISTETTLFVDLGLFGDDAAAFLAEFGRRLHVDLSHFLFDSHFLPEGYGWWEMFFPICASRRRYSATGRAKENLIPITVRQLVEAASIGRWPAESSRPASPRWES